MSMKDAIFGTAAPTSHGGATYRDSIQAWLPVKNIIGGVVITKDNRFIKILEVLPVNFYLKSPSDQQNIITSYAAYLKIAPDSMSCEVRTLPPDTSEYVEQMRQFQKTEESENCCAEIEDNIEKIGLGIASESIRHRFFLVFQYEAKMRAKRNTVKGIIQRLNEEADTARRYLDICELEVLEPRYTDDFVLKLLYELINIDGNGNRVASSLYGHKKVWFIVGRNKLAPTYEEALWRARNIAAPKNAQRLGRKTPCAVHGDRCYDCKSPERICRGLVVLWEAVANMEMEVVLIDQDLGY